MSQAAESSCEQDPGAERASSLTSDFQLQTARLVAPGDPSHDRDLWMDLINLTISIIITAWMNDQPGHLYCSWL